MSILIHPIPILKDNYVWTLIDEETQKAIVVDPGEAAPVEAFLRERHLTLSGILITHHHWDHTNGLTALAKQGMPVAGPARESIAGITLPVKEGDVFKLNSFPATFSAMDIPGHTLGHIAYRFDNNIFCGDTLFAAGCGRLFEGTAAQLYQSLQKIAELPEETVIYCAHEYTLNNLRFAALVEPNNPDIRERAIRVSALRDKGLPSLPSFLKEEKKTNPFLRCHVSDVIQQTKEYAGRSLTDPVDVFACLRQWKDKF